MPDEFTTTQGPVSSDAGPRCQACGADGKDQGDCVQCPVCGVLLSEAEPQPEVSDDDTPIFDALHATVTPDPVTATADHSGHQIVVEPPTGPAPSADATVGVTTVQATSDTPPPQ